MQNALIRVNSLRPTLRDSGFGRINSVISLIVEGDSFEAILDILDIGAGSDFVVMEEFSPGLASAI